MTSICKSLRPAASVLGIELRVLNASTIRDFDTVFASLEQHRASALLICPDVFSMSISNNSPRLDFGTRCRWSITIAHS